MTDFLILENAIASTVSGPTVLKAGRIISDSDFDVSVLQSQGVAIVLYRPEVMSAPLNAFLLGKQSDADLVALLLAAGAIGGNPAQGEVTGLLSGGLLSVNGGDPTTFDFTTAVGQIVDSSDPSNPVLLPITVNGLSGVSVPNLGSADFSVVCINSLGNVVFLADRDATPEESRTLLVLGVLFHPRPSTVVTGVTQSTFPASVPASGVADGFRLLSPWNISGNVYTPATTPVGLQIQRSAGVVYSFGAGYQQYNQLDPSSVPLAGVDPDTVLFYVYRDGSGDWTIRSPVGVVDQTAWDDGTGVLEVLANNRWKADRVYITIAGVTFLQYGQQEGTLNDILGSLGDPFDSYPGFATTAFRGWILSRGGATDPNDPNDMQFISAGNGLASGTGGGTSAVVTTQPSAEAASGFTAADYYSTASGQLRGNVSAFYAETLVRLTRPITVKNTIFCNYNQFQPDGGWHISVEGTVANVRVVMGVGQQSDSTVIENFSGGDLPGVNAWQTYGRMFLLSLSFDGTDAFLAINGRRFFTLTPASGYQLATASLLAYIGRNSNAGFPSPASEGVEVIGCGYVDGSIPSENEVIDHWLSILECDGYPDLDTTGFTNKWDFIGAGTAPSPLLDRIDGINMALTGSLSIVNRVCRF